ncbi:Cytochrome P450 CYP749A22 [Linum perenne]
MDQLGVTLLIFISSCLCSYLVLIIISFFNRAWWTPIRIQSRMRSQGIKGPPYRFFHGNTTEIFQMRSQSTETPMELSHHIFPRLLPHVYSWTKLYGKNYLQWYGSRAQLVVTEPELIKEDLIGDGLVVSRGEKWVKMRRLANHAFHVGFLLLLQGMVPAVIASVEMMLERWKNLNPEGGRKEIEAYQEFRLLTSEIISRTAFGSSYMEGEKVFELLKKMVLLISRNQFKVRIPGLSTFLRTGDEHESAVLQQDIKSTIMNMVAKREQENQQKQDNNMQLTMIINESLRLYPPFFHVSRKVERHQVRLGSGGLQIPKGTEVYIPFLAVHHGTETWGEDAQLFRPERFTEGISKGLGPRTCVGMNFAITQEKIAIAMILQRYRFTLSDKYVHSPTQVLNSCPRYGLQIVLEKLCDR